eukprot:Lithocolla_globosa_v1_NODE_345_length_4393_cov_6.676349.p2 type:complete len:318 gc:universal NODE_345_length_4393_cov_6.676349:789-1742(+)
MAWYLNDGCGNFSSQVAVGTIHSYSPAAAQGDLDLDGAVDVVLVSYFGDTIGVYWYWNDLKNYGTFSVHATGRYISRKEVGFFRPSSVTLGDIDNDGDLDVVSAFHDSDAVAWHCNELDSGSTFTTHLISTLKDAYFVALGDIDNDGDLDVVAASNSDTSNKMVWLANNNSTFNGEQLITSGWLSVLPFSQGITMCDFDGDRNLDVLLLEFPKVSLHLNTGDGYFVQTHAMEYYNPFLQTVGDIDDDGDLDVILGPQVNGDVAFYRNDFLSNGGFSDQHFIKEDSIAKPIALGDIDGDGDLDVLAIVNERLVGTVMT